MDNEALNAVLALTVRKVVYIVDDVQRLKFASNRSLQYQSGLTIKLIEDAST